MRLWPLKMPTQNVLMLLVLLMLMLWNVRACRQQFGWEFWSWCLIEILNLNICQDIESEVLSRFWSKFSSKLWSWSLLNPFGVKFGCFRKAFTSAQLNPRVRCAFGNVFQATLFQKPQQPSIIKFEVSETNTSGGACTVVSVWCQLSISARLVWTRVHFQLEYFNTIYTIVQYIISLIIHILLSLLYISYYNTVNICNCL